MPEIKCPDCRETMEIERDWYGRRVSCPSCQHKFTAEFPSSRPSRNDDFDDDRPRRKRFREEERPKSGNKKLFITLGIVGGLLLLAVCGCGGWGVWMFNSPVKYDGPWITHSLPDASASVQFPKSPKSEPIGDPAFGTNGSNYIFDEKFPKDAAFGFGYCDYPTGDTSILDDAIIVVRDAVKKEIGGTVQSDTTIAAYGQSVREITFKSGATTVTMRFIKVANSPKPRIIMLTAGGRNMPEPERKKFFDSFQFTAGKK